MREAAHEEPSDGDLLFAYGTLKRGGQYHSLIQEIEAEPMGSGSIVMPYPLLLAEYPCLLDQPGKGFRVSGEIFRIKRKQNWDKLDGLEGHPNEYLRRIEPVELNGAIEFAWTYFYCQMERLPHGLTAVKAFPVT